MEKLSDELLLESYFTARKLKLSKDFVKLIEKEIDKRSLANEINYTKHPH